jgi:hypothetical protein
LNLKLITWLIGSWAHLIIPNNLPLAQDPIRHVFQFHCISKINIKSKINQMTDWILGMPDYSPTISHLHKTQSVIFFNLIEQARWGCVQVMTYMIAPTALTYGTLFMCYLSSKVFGQLILLRETPISIGK